MTSKDLRRRFSAYVSTTDGRASAVSNRSKGNIARDQDVSHLKISFLVNNVFLTEDANLVILKYSVI